MAPLVFLLLKRRPLAKAPELKLRVEMVKRRGLVGSVVSMFVGDVIL
jgi:hypothetical protein